MKTATNPSIAKRRSKQTRLHRFLSWVLYCFRCCDWFEAVNDVQCAQFCTSRLATKAIAVPHVGDFLKRKQFLNMNIYVCCVSSQAHRLRFCSSSRFIMPFNISQHRLKSDGVSFQRGTRTCSNRRYCCYVDEIAATMCSITVILVENEMNFVVRANESENSHGNQHISERRIIFLKVFRVVSLWFFVLSWTRWPQFESNNWVINYRLTQCVLVLCYTHILSWQASIIIALLNHRNYWLV